MCKGYSFFSCSVLSFLNIFMIVSAVFVTIGSVSIIEEKNIVDISNNGYEGVCEINNIGHIEYYCSGVGGQYPNEYGVCYPYFEMGFSPIFYPQNSNFQDIPLGQDGMYPENYHVGQNISCWSLDLQTDRVIILRSYRVNFVYYIFVSLGVLFILVSFVSCFLTIRTTRRGYTSL